MQSEQVEELPDFTVYYEKLGTRRLEPQTHLGSPDAAQAPGGADEYIFVTVTNADRSTWMHSVWKMPPDMLLGGERSRC